jgi:hypothetical protein
MPKNTRKITRTVNQTRKQRYEEKYNEKKRIVDTTWIKFVNEGKLLFNFMFHNFTFMFDGDSSIKHFNIESDLYGLNIDKLNELYFNDIQKNLIEWIKNEYDRNQLTNPIYWKPFRTVDYVDIYLGYRYMFVYNEYYFQLSLRAWCSGCNYCETEKSEIHFNLTYYGSKENSNDMFLQPYNRYVVSPDNTMTNHFWSSK